MSDVVQHNVRVEAMRIRYNGRWIETVYLSLATVKSSK